MSNTYAEFIATYQVGVRTHAFVFQDMTTKDIRTKPIVSRTENENSVRRTLLPYVLNVLLNRKHIHLMRTFSILGETTKG